MSIFSRAALAVLATLLWAASIGPIHAAGMSSSMSPQTGGGIGRGFDGGISGVGGFTGTPLGPPTVTAVNPNTGSTSGGTPVVISGTNFNGATVVVFGANPAASFTVVNSTTINATSPAGAIATVDVRVTTPIGTSAIVVADQFTYGAGGCVADGKTDWSNACDIPLGVALGVF